MRSAWLQLILQSLAHLKWIPTHAGKPPHPDTINFRFLEVIHNAAFSQLVFFLTALWKVYV